VGYEKVLASFDVADHEQALGALLTCLPGSVLWLDAELRVRGLNRESVPGMHERLLGQNILDFAGSEDRLVAERCYEAARATGLPQKLSSRSIDTNGKILAFETEVAPLVREGILWGFLLYSRDVTQFVRGESNLALAVRATGMGLWSFDVRQGVVEWNPEMYAITGSEVPLDPSRYLADLVHPDDRPLTTLEKERAYDRGALESAPHRIVRPNGEVRWVMTLGNIELGTQGQPVFMHGATIDITDQKLQEQAVIAAKKSEAIGLLAAGIAHNFNNLLCVITPALEAWTRTATTQELPLARDARMAAHRAADLVKQLVSFARLSKESSPEVRNLREDVDEALRLGGRVVGEGLELDVELPESGVSFSSLDGQLESVIVNLIVNARDALRDVGRTRGRMTVRTDLDAVAPPAQLDFVGPWVALEFHDDGPGMTEEVRERIFDPFFTTKQPGRGTGLGLSTAYATMTRLGGAIECRSLVGEGTTFVLYVPRQALAAPVEQAQQLEAATPAAELAVLVVDDEELVRRALLGMLGRGGLVPVGASGAAEALELLERRTFDVALLDRSMPGLDGVELGRRLRRSHPDMKLLLVTGSEVAADEAAVFDGMLQKPLGGHELLAAVAALFRHY